MTRRLRSGFLLVFLLFVVPMLFAQSNDMIDRILAEDVASIGSVAYVALSAAELINDDTTPARAVRVASEAGWLPEQADASAPASFGQMAFLMMQALEVNGGLMYRLFPGPRYAAREFVYRKWSPERKAPGDRISGQFLLRVAGNFLESTGVAP